MRTFISSRFCLPRFIVFRNLCVWVCGIFFARFFSHFGCFYAVMWPYIFGLSLLFCCCSCVLLQRTVICGSINLYFTSTSSSWLCPFPPQLALVSTATIKKSENETCSSGSMYFGDDILEHLRKYHWYDCSEFEWITQQQQQEHQNSDEKNQLKLLLF